PHQLDDRPLLVRDVDRRPDRLCEQLRRPGAGALREISRQSALDLPELCSIDAVAFDHHHAIGDERPHRRLEWTGISDSEDPAAIALSTDLAAIGRPDRVRTSRSRSGSRSSSPKMSSASKWLTIARAKAGPIPGTRAINQPITPSAVCGSDARKFSTVNCHPY